MKITITIFQKNEETDDITNGVDFIFDDLGEVSDFIKTALTRGCNIKILVQKAEELKDGRNEVDQDCDRHLRQ